MIYLLALQDGKYYVGKTLQSDLSRLNEHFKGNGSVWTQTHAPIRILALYPDSTEVAEDRITLDTMQTYGWENVRGGQWSRVELREAPLELREHCHTRRNITTCFRCGNSGHWSKHCTNFAQTRCTQCHHLGHLSTQCPVSDIRCFLCAQQGHLMHDCPTVRCFQCGQQGHKSRVCPKPVQCFRCRQLGHRSHDCTDPPICLQCGKQGHMARECYMYTKKSTE